ncbi:MAG: flippase-like domain-containing protein [Elusimicrobia bacterium]|nr:flippase-like domain-containing protein [Elusimicrobiota bacterium]
MTRSQKAIIGIATVCLAYLLWRIDPREIWGYVTAVGWGLALILAQEVVPHTLNALGWRYSFRPAQAGAYSLLELFRLRIAGDGVNYLTPSATIAGEFMRAASLDPRESAEVRYASVAVAKVSQAIAQLVFMVGGVGFVIATGRSVTAGPYRTALNVVFWLLLSALVAFFAASAVAWRLIKDRRIHAPSNRLERWLAGFGDIPRQSLGFLADHPVRFGFSAVLFAGGYAWSSIEGYMICYFLGVPISMTTAVVIEVLSNVIDSLMFMVPMKVGTQEGGKTAIFLGLGLKPAAGFAFGVIRHIREMAWAAFGLVLCYAGGPKAKPKPPVTPSKAALAEEPFSEPVP